MKIKQTLIGLSTLLALASALSPTWAQNEIRTVTHVRLKPGKAGDFNAAVKDLAALQVKGGATHGFTIWQSLSGPAEYAVVAYSSKWAEMDQTVDPKMKDHQGALAAIRLRLNACAESIETEIHTMLPELTSPQSRDMPAYVRAGRTSAAPGKLNDLIELFKTDLVPAWKKAGVTAYGVARVRYGAPNNQLHTFTAMKSWADLDGPPPVQTAMGTAAYQAFLTKTRALTLRTEYTIYRFRPELSYIPAAQ